MPSQKLVSFVVPAYNEAENINPFFASLTDVLSDKYHYEFIFVNDGSIDDTIGQLKLLKDKNGRVKIVNFSRNFGKEAATTAGIYIAKGDATIILDADGQHPVEKVPEMLKKWSAGAQTVIGIRQEYANEGLTKKVGSKLFYKLFNSLTDQKLIPGSTDFRLINRDVRKSFNALSEHNRMTRALLDWLGFKKEFIYFNARPRLHGEATYSTKKLLNLAFSSFVSLSLFPIYISSYIGLLITPLSFLLGAFIVIEQFILGDPMVLNVTGAAMLGILITFLVGIILLSQGILAIYISKIYDEAKARPLYVIDEGSSDL